MDARLSAHRRKTLLRAACPLPPLLNLPLDLIVLICSHIEEASICCLAITCKSLFHSLRWGLGTQESRLSFLSLIERDLCEHFFVCYGCTRLHRYDKWWSPTNYESGYSCGNMAVPHHFLNHVAGRGKKYVLSYEHVRLVTNCHKFGANKGLPLGNLKATLSSETPVYPCPGSASGLDGLWRQQWSARIINNELFLQAQHHLQAPNEEMLRRAIGQPSLLSCYQLCFHVRITSRCRLEKCPRISTRPKPLDTSGPWAACQNVPGFCKRCLTDYTVTIETPDSSSTPGWRLSILTYHQLGDGKTPEDWKWAAFRVSGRKAFIDESGTLRYRHDRDLQIYPPGLVKDTWKQRPEQEN